jgi:tight adherence protein B
MGALIGLGVGVGLLLVWSAFATPRAPRRPRDRSGWIARRLGEAGMNQVSVPGVAVLSLGLGAGAALAVQVLSGTPPVAFVFGAMAAYVPFAVVSGRARRRRREFAEVWPEAVDNLASAVRAGMSLPDALAALGTRGPEPLRPAFDSFALDYQVTGRFGDSLDRLKDELADPVGDRVVEGLRIAREVGGGDAPPAAGRSPSCSSGNRSAPPGTTPSMRSAGVAVWSSTVTLTRSSRSTSACWSRLMPGSLSAAA